MPLGHTGVLSGFGPGRSSAVKEIFMTGRYRKLLIFWAILFAFSTAVILFNMRALQQNAGDLLPPAIGPEDPDSGEDGEGTKPERSPPAVLSEDPRIAFKTAVRAQHIIGDCGSKVAGPLGPRALRL